MKHIIIRLADSNIHNYLKKQLGFPDYYGKNSDALYDELTSISEETMIEIILPQKQQDSFIPLEVFLDAESENPYLHITLR